MQVWGKLHHTWAADQKCIAGLLELQSCSYFYTQYCQATRQTVDSAVDGLGGIGWRIGAQPAPRRGR